MRATFPNGVVAETDTVEEISQLLDAVGWRSYFPKVSETMTDGPYKCPGCGKGLHEVSGRLVHPYDPLGYSVCIYARLRPDELGEAVQKQIEAKAKAKAEEERRRVVTSEKQAKLQRVKTRHGLKERKPRWQK